MGDTDGNIVTINSVSKATVSGVRRNVPPGKTIYLNRAMVKRDQKSRLLLTPIIKIPELMHAVRRSVVFVEYTYRTTTD